MKPSKLRLFYTNKMELEQHNGKHITYIMRLRDKKLHLPPIAHHSHGKKDIPTFAINNLAKRVGLNIRNFKLAVSCYYKRDSILLCIATKYLANCRSDPITYPPKHIIPTVTAIFLEADADHKKRPRKKWNSEEKNGLKTCKKMLNIIQDNSHLKDISKSIDDFIDNYW